VPARIVDWYRVDPWPRIRRVIAIGPSILTLGGLVVAVSFLTHQPESVRIEAAIVGLVLVAGAAIFTAIGMGRILRDDAYLAIRTDGVAVRVGSTDAVVPWDELEEARWDALQGALVLVLADGRTLVAAARFARVTGPELAGLVTRARQRAAMNLLR
jgi:hypothetical protein